MIELGTPRYFLDAGLRMVGAGDLSGAQDFLLKAVNSGDAEVLPQAAHSLGVLLMESDPVTAEKAFQLAIDSGDRQFGGLAAFALASLYQHHGNLVAALQMFEVATHASDEETSALAREAMRSLSDARAELMAGMGPAEAAFTEGVHLRATGDDAGAVAALERCMATEDAEFAPYAASTLGAIMAGDGDFERAKPPLLAAVQSGHATYAPMSAYVLAEILLEEGDRAAARELLPLAARHPDPNTARDATAILADLQATDG